MSSLPYEEPSIETILINSSLLVLLNFVNFVLDRLLYCGLLAQVLLGVAWGAPGGAFLATETQHVIVQLGYLGLILLVYEGGLSVPIQTLKANVLLSTCVAATGLATPFALSFLLEPLLGITSLQAFAAGAALCSTSLGTTFTLLSTSGLSNTRLGTVLSTAAMMDDVIGLVIVQIISNLSPETSQISAVVVIRPLLVSLAFAVFVPIVCHYMIHAVRVAAKEKNLGGRVGKMFNIHEIRLLTHIVLLTGLVAAGSYAGTSNLFTAYLAGAIVNWWDNDGLMIHKQNEDVPEQPNASQSNELPARGKRPADANKVLSGNPPDVTGHSRSDDGNDSKSNRAAHTPSKVEVQSLSGCAIYHQYLAQPVERVLKPFFFASIGFSIPIASLFEGKIVWRGIIYTILMLFSKLVCGVWLLRFPSTDGLGLRFVRGWARFRGLCLSLVNGKSTGRKPSARQEHQIDVRTNTGGDSNSHEAGSAAQNGDEAAQGQCQPETASERRGTPSTMHLPQAPLSLYPAAMLGSAMVARGEIGFLIASVAESQGIWHNGVPQTSPSEAHRSSDVFLIVTWAIFLCTLVGPLALGLIVRRVKALEKTKEASGRRDAVLGSWGIAAM